MQVCRISSPDKELLEIDIGGANRCRKKQWKKKWYCRKELSRRIEMCHDMFPEIGWRWNDSGMNKSNDSQR